MTTYRFQEVISSRCCPRRRVVKVRAQFRMVFSVTREVEVDEQDFDGWALRRYGEGFDRELALTVWIDDLDTDSMAEVFSDFRTNEPLPADFEFQYSETKTAHKLGYTVQDRLEMLATGGTVQP